MNEVTIITNISITTKQYKMLSEYSLVKNIPMNQLINNKATYKVMQVAILDGKIILIEQKPDRMLSHELKLVLKIKCTEVFRNYFYEIAEKKEYSCLGEILHDDIMYYDLEVVGGVNLKCYVGNTDKKDRATICGNIKIDRDYEKMKKLINNG